MRINREKLAVAMIRADLNGNQLAKKAAISRGTVTAIRSGKSCSYETAIRISMALGVTLTEIAHREAENAD